VWIHAADFPVLAHLFDAGVAANDPITPRSDWLGRKGGEKTAGRPAPPDDDGIADVGDVTILPPDY
jgi:hypothetical protein